VVVIKVFIQMKNPDIHLYDEFTGLTIYTRDATYSSNKHFGSFVYWELVDMVSSLLVAIVTIFVWEFVFRDLVL